MAPALEAPSFVTTSHGRFAFVAREPSPASVPARGTALYLHGFPDCPLTAGALFDALAARGYRVRAPFLRGYAPSTIEGPFSLEQLTLDARALVDALCPDEPALVLGHDWGAVVTYALCAAHPSRVRAAVTMAVPHPLAFVRALLAPAQLRKSWYMLFFQSPIAPERAVARRDFALIDRLWREWSPGFALDPEARAALHETLRQSDGAPIEYYRAMTRPLATAIARLRGPLAAAIDVPVLHLQGAEDGCIGPEACEQQQQHFRGPFAQAVLAGAGHFLPQELPEVIAERADRWFNEHGAGGRAPRG